MMTVNRWMAAGVSMLVLRYIAKEVQRQGDAPIAVYWMARAWESAQQAKEMDLPVTPGLIEQLGQLVHPEANLSGFRTVNVQVGSHVAPHNEHVSALIGDLCGRIAEGASNPETAYLEFQKIHPFRDGNGRVGKILFNYLRGSLSLPAMPPNFFGCANP